MKTKIAGMVLLAAVIAGAGLYALISQQNRVQVLNGYLGGEKIGLFEDEEVQDILRKNTILSWSIRKPGLWIW